MHAYSKSAGLYEGDTIRVVVADYRPEKTYDGRPNGPIGINGNFPPADLSRRNTFPGRFPGPEEAPLNATLGIQRPMRHWHHIHR